MLKNTFASQFITQMAYFIFCTPRKRTNATEFPLKPDSLVTHHDWRSL